MYLRFVHDTDKSIFGGDGQIPTLATSLDFLFLLLGDKCGGILLGTREEDK